MEQKLTDNRIGKKIEIALIVVAAITLLLALFFPLIIWDALGNGAEHFMRYGNVGVSGASDGSSKATFFFGLDYTLAHMSTGFIPAELFAAQWRVVLGVTEASPAADGLGVITMILTALLFVSLLAMIVVYVLDRFFKIGFIGKILKYFSAAVAGIEFLTVIWFLIIALSMIGQIKPYGFRTYDFMAYGGVKMLIEAIASAALCTLNTILFIKLLRVKKGN